MRKTTAQKLGNRLYDIQQAQGRASDAMMHINAAAEVIRVQTTRLREALHTIERNAERAHLLLDELETASGLVDENGQRIDEV